METNTYEVLELSNGVKVNLTLNFYRLYQLKPKNNNVYQKYNNIMTKGPKEELDMITILYTAYLCANINEVEKCMSEIEFLQLMPDDRGMIQRKVQGLTGPKKK